LLAKKDMDKLIVSTRTLKPTKLEDRKIKQELKALKKLIKTLQK
jgi:hypothetical protein